MCLKTSVVFVIIAVIFILFENVEGKVIYPADGRIVGGQEANISYFPYQVSLRKYKSHICGAAIFHPFYVISAAHCSIGLASAFSIRVGSSNLRSGGLEFQICQVITHEGFDDTTMDNDVALFKLCDPLTFSKTILPVYIPEKNEVLKEGTMASISGWGHTKENGSISPILQQTQVPIVSRRRCRQIFGSDLTDNMICAGYEFVGGKDACQGDSGGPLLANGKLFGVVSWGIGCAQPRYPGVYTNVPKYRDWIRKITNY